jgi:hypothetical protein
MEGDLELKEDGGVKETARTMASSNFDAVDCDNASKEVVYEWVGWGSLSRQERYDLVGWILFVISASFYTVAAIEFAHITSLIASLAFLFACFPFMIVLLRKEKIR